MSIIACIRHAEERCGGRCLPVFTLWVFLWGQAGGSIAAGDPDWFNKPQFFSYFYGYYYSPESKLDQVTVTGQAAGIYLPSNDSDDNLRREVRLWHSQRRIYFSYTTLTGIYQNPRPEWDSFRWRNLDGNYVNKGDAPLYSLSSPIFRSFLKDQARRAVDIGSDGFYIDDIQGLTSYLLWSVPRAAPSFDNITMVAFRSYLQQKYSTDALQRLYGISDSATFDFGVYIRTRGLADTWNKLPLTGLSAEFFLFARQEIIDFLRDLIPSTKQYAAEKYNRNDFVFTCNGNSDPVAYFLTEAMDITSPELFYIRGSNHPFMAIDVKMWKGWRSPVIIHPEAMPPSLGVSNPLIKATVNLERVIIADIQAAGGIPTVNLYMNSGLGSPQPVDLAVVRRYANFILAHPQLMSQTITPARIALVHSAPSMLGARLSISGAINPWNAPTAYVGTARLLLDGGYTYDSPFFPDSTYSRLQSPKAADLARYSTVIAPSVFALDDNQVAALLAYALQGGTLVIIGDFATNHPSGAQASHPELQPLMAKPGVTAYGNGHVVYSKQLFGVEYQNADNKAQRQARTDFQSFIAPYVQSDIQVSGVSAVLHEPGVTPFFYRDKTGQALVHLVNYDYDDATDLFYTKNNVTVSVRVGTQVVDEVILRSPDINGAQSLPFTRSDDAITVVVPQVEAWDVLLFQKNLKAPTVSSATPAAAIGAVGGTTIPFSVEASDPDGNPLTYTWTVNSQVVTDVFGPAYTLQLPTSTKGLYTVAVTITDGSRTTQKTWNVNVAAYRPPRVLFDESHNERDTIDAARAAQLNPEHPSWILYGILVKTMQPSYQVSSLASGPITAEVLSGADVLVLAAPRMALTAAENQAIINFVQAGGGLIFLGDSGLSTPINTLLGQWGIQFDRTLIGSLQTTCLGCFFLNSFVDHPAMATDPSFYTNYGGSLTISGEAVALGFTSAAEWRSLSELPTKQPAEASGPFVMVAAAQAGRGRVFVVSDDAFHDDYIRSISRVGNLNLFLSALAWLSASVNATPPPTVPVTTTTSTTAQVSTTTAITATTTTRTVTTATSTTTTTTSSSTTTTTTTTLPPGQANVIDFAHIAVGGPYRAFLTLNNPGTGAVSATILFRQPNAYPLSLTISGVAGSSRAITLPAKGLLRLNLEDPGTNIKTGWCQVFSSAPINGLLVYQLLSEQAIVSEASVLPSTRARGFMLPVSQLGAESLTGLALAAVDTQPAQISLRFYRPDGVVLSTSSLTLKSGEGISRFLTEFIPGLAATQEGTLEIVSDRTLIAVALLFQGSVFTSLPVTPLP